MFFVQPAGALAKYSDSAQVRMFKDIDVDKLNLWKYDGFNRLQPRYEV